MSDGRVKNVDNIVHFECVDSFKSFLSLLRWF